jgi:hypothetical protein
VVWEEEIAQAKSSLSSMKEVKLLWPARGLKGPREVLTPGENQEIEADISWTTVFGRVDLETIWKTCKQCAMKDFSATFTLISMSN